MSAPLVLSVKDAALSFHGKVLFESLSFNIHQGNRISLVGKNGAGKTTLMRLICGELEMDDGERWEEAGISIGYMKQDVVPKENQTVFEYIFEEIKAEDKELHEYKVEMMADVFELDVNAQMTHLSGGQIRRAALARSLVEEPDILLLDEPTNHLDLGAIEWLEDYLKSYRGTLLCISHDKMFLANISNKVFWLDRGTIKVCPKGFGYFEEWSEMLLEQEARELKNRAVAVAQEVEWASRGVKARRKRNVRRLEKMYEAREQLKKDMSAYRRVTSKIVLAPPQEADVSSRVVAEFYNVTKSFSRDGEDDLVILDKFDLRIKRGDRVGILGKNGSGKTTFLKLLIGEQKADSGKVKRAQNIEVSYFDQKRRDLDPDHTLWKTLCPEGGEYVDVGKKQRHVCGYLKDFMFDPQDAQRKVATLSGGEKNRLMLARVLANPGNFLILDEPTNDLDMDTLDMLEDILSEYDGTLFVVSHDRDFLDQMVTKILAFEGDGKVEGYIGGYSDYLEAVTARKAREGSKDGEPEDNKPSSSKKSSVVSSKEQAQDVRTEHAPVKMSYKLKYELEQLPSKIEKLEAEIEKLQSKLSDPDFYGEDPDKFHSYSIRLPKAKEELEKAETRWLELEDLRARASG